MHIVKIFLAVVFALVSGSAIADGFIYQKRNADGSSRTYGFQWNPPQQLHVVPVVPVQPAYTVPHFVPPMGGQSRSPFPDGTRIEWDCGRWQPYAIGGWQPACIVNGQLVPVPQELWQVTLPSSGYNQGGVNHPQGGVQPGIQCPPGSGRSPVVPGMGGSPSYYQFGQSCL